MNRPHIKFCGMTRRKDIITAIDLGVNFIGFIFYKLSPRYISPIQAKILCKGIDFKNTQKVGVFVNTPLTEIAKVVLYVGIHVIQLHNDNDVNKIKEFEKQTKTKLWKTVRIKNKKSLEIIRQNQLEYFLIDTYSHNSYGGTGKRIDLDLVKESCQLQKRTEKGLEKKIIVAGGLNSKNIKNILPYSPWGVDINSGIEKGPGVKDHQQMKAIMQKILHKE